jgi:hypothetical protein
MIKHKRFSALAFIFLLLMPPVFAFYARSNARDMSARAGDVAQTYTIRLYSLVFDFGYDLITGANGYKYTVSLWQDDATSPPVSMKLYYNDVGGKKFLSVAAGVIDKAPGGQYYEFKIPDYKSLRLWSVTYQGTTYPITPGNAKVDVSISGEFWADGGGEWVTPMSSVYDEAGSPLYYLADGTVVDKENNPILDLDDQDGSVVVYYDNGKFTNAAGYELSVSEPEPEGDITPVSGNISYTVNTGAITDGTTKRYILSASDKAKEHPKGIALSTLVYRVTVRENYKDAPEYVILCTLTFREMTYWEKAFVKPFNNRVNEVWYDLRGHEIDVGAYAKFDVDRKWAPFKSFGDMTPGEKVGTVFTLDWIRFYALLAETVPVAVGTIDMYIGEVLVDGKPYYEENPAVYDTHTEIYDAAGSVVSIGPGNQLYDAAGWPLFSSYGLPCYSGGNGAFYSVDDKGAHYQMLVNSDGQLVDNQDVVVRSAITDITDGQTMWFYYGTDGITTISGFMEWDPEANGGKGDYKNINPVTGEELPDDLIVKATPLPGDPLDPHPDRSGDELTLWDKILNILYIAAIVIVSALVAFFVGWLVIKLIRVLKNR